MPCCCRRSSSCKVHPVRWQRTAELAKRLGAPQYSGLQVLDERVQLRIIPLKLCHVAGVHCVEKNIVLVVVVSALGCQLDGALERQSALLCFRPDL